MSIPGFRRDLQHDSLLSSLDTGYDKVAYITLKNS